jgi:hypothetical protein
LGLAFFGLTPEYRNLVFQQLHEIVFHGKGGYTWSDVYNMPIWLRKYTFMKLKEYYDKQNEEVKAQSKTKELARPDIKPSYSTKASK